MVLVVVVAQHKRVGSSTTAWLNTVSLLAIHSATLPLRRRTRFAVSFAGPSVHPTMEREAMHRVLDEVPDLAEEVAGPLVGTEHRL